MDLRWFNVSGPRMRVGRTHMRLWSAFNRCAQDGHWWGFGLFQIGKRHLFYVGHSGLHALFLRPTP